MAQEEVFNGEDKTSSYRRIAPRPEDSQRAIMVSNDGFGKLVFLRRAIIDADATCEKIRRLVNSINEEIYVANEEIRNKLLANQKRLELLKEARERLERYETSKLISYEEFVSIIKLDDVYDNVVYNSFNNMNVNESCD